MRYRLFSVDDHVIEPPHVWESRLPTRYREVGPRVIEADGRQYWEFEGKRVGTMGLNAVAGKPPEEWGLEPRFYTDMLTGCYDPHVRAKDMEEQGIVGSVPFPTLPGFGGRVFYEMQDKVLADLCIKAYNDYMLEEWCAASPSFYVPTIIVQLWDPVLGAAEIRRCASLGARTVSLPDNASPMGLPSYHCDYWDPLLRAVEETGMVVSMHISSSGRNKMWSPEQRYSTVIAVGPAQDGMQTVADLLFSRMPTQFPGIRFVVTEGGIGYMPYLLERLDDVWEKSKAWDELDSEMRPSDVFRRSFWVCAVNEEFGLRNRHDVGVDRILWESDYPHAETPWPYSQAAAEKQFAGMDASEIARISHLNAQELFSFAGASW